MPSRRLRAQTIEDVRGRFRRVSSSRRGLEAVWALISAVDKFIVERAPWKLARQPDAAGAILTHTLYTAAEALRIVTALLSPVLPESTPKIWAQLGMTRADRIGALRRARLGRTAGRARRSAKSRGVFPRIEAKPAIDKMQRWKRR